MSSKCRMAAHRCGLTRRSIQRQMLHCMHVDFRMCIWMRKVCTRARTHTQAMCVCACLVCACISAYMYVWCVHVYLLTCMFGVCMHICLHVCLVCACISAYMYVWCVHAYLLTCMVCVQVLVLTRDGLFKRIAMRGLPMFSRRSCTHAHMHKQIRVRVLVFSMRGLLLLSLRWSVSTCVYLRKCV